MDFTHVAYSDESNYNNGVFRSVALVSLREADRAIIEQTVREILFTSAVKEFKWKALRSARERFAATKVARYLVGVAKEGKIRIDVLCWKGSIPSDLKTRRNAVESLEVMYYHLLRTVLAKKWSHENEWAIVADQHSGIDWPLLHQLTNLSGWEPRITQADDHLVIDSYSKFDIVSLSTGNSAAEPFIQVADLFAGVAAFSREHGKRYWQWQRGQNTGKLAIDGGVSGSERERFQFISDLNAVLKEQSIDVALGYAGFITLNPEVPINFWHWIPRAALEAKQSKLVI